jgi:hypothetical protein
MLDISYYSKGGIRNFVQMHSWFTLSMPALLGISTSLAGTALFIGIDCEHGMLVSYVGLGGSLLGGVILGMRLREASKLVM